MWPQVLWVLFFIVYCNNVLFCNFSCQKWILYGHCIIKWSWVIFLAAYPQNSVMCYYIYGMYCVHVHVTTFMVYIIYSTCYCIYGMYCVHVHVLQHLWYVMCPCTCILHLWYVLYTCTCVTTFLQCRKLTQIPASHEYNFSIYLLYGYINFCWN